MNEKPCKLAQYSSAKKEPSKILKFGFSEKATKFEKNLCRTFDKSVVFCARNSALVKKLTKIFQNKCGQVVLYKLYILICFLERYHNRFVC